MEIFKIFYIEAAHYLPNVPDGHKCKRLHGHSFRIEIYISGDNSNDQGWVQDFADISEKFKPIFNQLDHRYLNKVEGLENPTSENLAKWIWVRLIVNLPNLSRIIIQETCTTGCIYTAD